uniref:GATA zinc finger domain containing 2A n=1 Tax=Zosterops lateralis melanops TaxID=1220523 RepID=A0A8D2Q030_ZOSLA
MSEEPCRTRSQKRALERDSEPDNKKLRMDKGIVGSDPPDEPELKIKSPEAGAGAGAGTGTGKIPGMLKGGEVKATIKVELPAGDGDGDEPVDMSTSSKGSPEQRERLINPIFLYFLYFLPPEEPRAEGKADQSHFSHYFSLFFPIPEEPRAEGAPSSSRIPGSGIPPPLLRGGQTASSKLGSQQSPQIVMPPLVRGAQQIHTIRQHSSTGPPPLLLAPRASVPSVQIQGQRIIQQGLIRVANVPNASLLVNIPQGWESPTPACLSTSQAPGSRQAAAKLALRKQLEKTLLEIPPPKPPAPEMNFLPSAANNEFIYLVGLEEVVQNLLETQGKVAVAVSCREPYLCAQCHTDFTCRWREEKNGTIMCETCMASNQKKALKAEHTNRLKAAFVKALQQEQEIEQRILQQTAPPGQPKAEPVGQHHALKQVRVQMVHRGKMDGSCLSQGSSQMSRGAGASRGVLHSFSPSPKLQSSSGSAALGSRSGKHAERSGSKGSTAAWKKNPISTGGALPFVSPSLAVHKSSSAVDRQREYLLDMIPPRSIPQSATWK